MKIIKKYKLVILLLLVLLFTGCTGNYNVTINDNLSVNEELNLELENNNGEYEKTLNIFKENNIKEDNYHISINNSKVVIKYNDKFNSIDDYILNSKVYHELIDEIKYSKDGNNIDIYIDEILKLNDDGKNIGNVSDIDSLKINIKNPFKVITSNEDSLDGNTYTWNITNETVNKKILMQFETKQDKISYGKIITIVVLVICIETLAYIIIKNYKNAHKI